VSDIQPFGPPEAVIPLPARAHTLDISNDGSLLVVSMNHVRDGAPAIRVHGLPSGELLATVDTQHSRGAVFVDDGDAIVYLRNLETPAVALERLAWREPGSEPQDLGASPLSIRKLVRSHSGSLLAVVGSDLEVFSLAEDRTIRFLKGPKRSGELVACFSRDERSIYIAHLEEGQLIQQDLRSGEELARWPIKPDNGGQIIVSKSGRFVALHGRRGAAIFDGDTPLYSTGKLKYRRRTGTVALFDGDESFAALPMLGAPWLLALTDESGWLQKTEGDYPGLNTIAAKAHDAEVYAWAREDSEFKHDVLVYRR